MIKTVCYIKEWLSLFGPHCTILWKNGKSSKLRFLRHLFSSVNRWTILIHTCPIRHGQPKICIRNDNRKSFITLHIGMSRPFEIWNIHWTHYQVVIMTVFVKLCPGLLIFNMKCPWRRRNTLRVTRSKSIPSQQKCWRKSFTMF